MMKRLLLNDKFILILILLNAIIIFVSGFEMSPNNRFTLSLIDNIITGFFIAEIITKFKEFGIKNYFRSNWNKFDFILVALSFPTLIAFVGNFEVTSFSFLLVFRVMRVFKSFRFLKFIPGIEHLIKGISRALKASIIVLIGFVIYIFIIGIFSFYLFKEISPEYFGNPLNSLYSTFKIFTVEGWYEVPEQLTKNLSPTTSFFTYLYFIFVVISGGIFGLSLVNSIFVDAMISDNNDELEKKVELIDKKIDKLLAINEES
ncbi:MAG: ion transporter [Bacteroidales bacterium]|nr:ion transporter [Bacteroidales bacterium]